MNAFFRIIAPLLLAVVTGCHSIPTLSPKEAFFQKHPELRAHYHEFWATSPEAVVDADSDTTTSKLILVHSIQERYGKYPDLMESMDIVEKRIVSIRDKHPLVDEINKVFDPRTDTLFWYVYEDGEKGHMIIRNGDCYRKFVAEGPMTIGKP
jgi:hypothetical protein